MRKSLHWTVRLFQNLVVDADSGCWLWQGSLNADGYGVIRVGGRSGKQWLVHCLIYVTCFGPVPKGKELDHRCRRRNCAAPHHVEAVTHAENVRRGGNAVKKRCPQGHRYNKSNTYTGSIKGRTYRQCRVCHRATELNRYRRRKAA